MERDEDVLALQPFQSLGGADQLTLHGLNSICEQLSGDVSWLINELRALRASNAVPDTASTTTCFSPLPMAGERRGFILVFFGAVCARERHCTTAGHAL